MEQLEEPRLFAILNRNPSFAYLLVCSFSFNYSIPPLGFFVWIVEGAVYQFSGNPYTAGNVSVHVRNSLKWAVYFHPRTY